MLYLDTCSSACHRQLCSHSSYWFSCQNMYTSHFLLFLSKHSSVPMFKCLDIPFPATLPSCQSKHAAVLVETEELRSTVLQTLAAGCTVYCSLSAQQRPRSGHVSRRKHLQDDCPALCQSSSIKIHDMIKYPMLYDGQVYFYPSFWFVGQDTYTSTFCI